MDSNTANSAAAEAANLSNPKLRNTWIRISDTPVWTYLYIMAYKEQG